MRVGFFPRLRKLARRSAVRIRFLRIVQADPRTPRRARFLITLGLLYLLSPIDLIPDWIPLLGQIDDLVIVPLLIGVGLALVPKELRYTALRQATKTRTAKPAIVE